MAWVVKMDIKKVEFVDTWGVPTTNGAVTYTAGSGGGSLRITHADGTIQNHDAAEGQKIIVQGSTIHTNAQTS